MRFLKRIYGNLAKKLKYYSGVLTLIVYSTRNYIMDPKGRKRINDVIIMPTAQANSTTVKRNA